ncbi:MAG: PQQ-binding-like beta-propeller repeat protein [Spirochaetes bacterium]|jgi:outer membrane protein assembly factor BamB|nr:PQQ-binding-like beta-propeller repeat protein [Spirochaetota bacterium]
MRSLNKINPDHLVLGISALIITTFSLLLYLDFTRKIEAGSAKKIGTISFKKKVAQRKYMAQVVWEDVQQNSPVYNNDSLRTSDLSIATVSLQDGTKINLDENSMILLSFGANAININFTQGSISASRNDVSGDDVARLNIQSRDTTVSMDKSDVKLTKTETRDLNMTVTRGSATVVTGKDEKKIGKDEKLVVSDATRETRVYKLNIRLKGPQMDSLFITTEKTVPVSFSWEAAKGGDLFLEISRSSGFRDRVTYLKVDSDTAAVNLPEGSYYWRLKAVDPATRSEDFSDTWNVSIIGDRPVRLLNPLPDEAVSYTVKPPIIGFRWGKNDIANDYTLEVSRDQNFSKIIKSVQTPLTEISVDDLDAGRYFWRIRTNVSLNRSYRGASPVHALVVEKKNVVEPPELISPKDQKRVSRLMLEKKDFIFSWKADPQVKNYEILISSDEKFQKIVLSAKSSGNFFTFTEPVKAGDYFWRVRPVSEKVDEAAFSPTRRFSVLDADRISVISPQDKSRINIDENEKNPSQTFKWKESVTKGLYLFELSKDQAFTSVISSSLVEKSDATAANLAPGAYYWRVKLLDSDRSEIVSSDVISFEMTKKVITQLTVKSPVPQSSIYINSRLAGHDSVTINPLPGERLLIEVDAGGYEKFSREVSLAEGEKRTIQAEFIGGAKLTVISPVKNSKIFVNGKYIGADRVVIMPGSGKQIAVEIKALGFKSYNTTLELKPGETREIKAVMETDRALNRVKFEERVNTTVLSKPVFLHDRVIVVRGDGTLSAVSNEGRALWNVKFPSRVESAPEVGKSSVYVVQNNGELYSVDFNSGRINWKKKLEGSLIFQSKPLAVEDRVYVATSSGKTYAFSEKGEQIWVADIESGIYVSPAYGDKKIFLAGDDCRVYALDTDDGDVDWTRKLDGRIVSSSPMVHEKTLFIGSMSGTFYALKSRNGSERWSYKTGDSILSTAETYKDRVFIGSNDGSLYAFSIDDGKLLWTFASGSRISTEPAVSGNLVFVSSGNSIFGLNAETGAREWAYASRNRIRTSPTVIGNDIYFGLENGGLTAVRYTLVEVFR